MHSPSDGLARIIIEKLVRERLLTRQEGKKLLSKLADGTLHADDWRIAIERGASKGES